MNHWKRTLHLQPSSPGAGKTRSRHKPHRVLATACTLTVATFSGISGIMANGQQPVTVDVKARSQDVIAHLNAVLRFYRATSTPIQKVGEPNDIVYRDQAVALSMQAANLAFQSGNAEAGLLTSYEQQHGGAQSAATGNSQADRLQQALTKVEGQQATLKTSIAALDKQMAAGRVKNMAALQAQRKGQQESLDLSDAMYDALKKIINTSGTAGASQLTTDIGNLQRSVPELTSQAKPVAEQLTTLDASRSAGVSSQTITLFQLLSTEHSLDTLIQQNESLRQQAIAFRAPLSSIAHNLVLRGQQLSQQTLQTAPNNTGASTEQATDTELLAVTAGFRSVAAASVPLSQEVVVLEQSEANLKAWQAAVDREYKSILHSLLLRLLVIAIALVVIFLAGELWTRAANKYVRDRRRRRQLLMTRRVVVGFLSALVLLFGFITQFNSLATFAGFITAGIAVGLQTILLSVAAYFFIIGKYGIKVGDRITIASVTGDVIDVGLVRFYVMELAGSGTELKPSGRVAVFSNSVLFQAGTPLYKQLPGSDFAWHELLVKFTANADTKKASEQLLKVMHTVYDEYRHAIEQDHHDLERWMQVSSAMPEIESRVQFLGGAVQLWARFPVQLRRAAVIDEELTSALLELLTTNTELRSAVDGLPIIQPSVRG
ncbi:mechanosensitive ion channel domain-containing protein [Silvibacterium dinghuense]|uniref:Mechanosensitive ion channel n=1 Tax=Silvibacterium dinghuense TaxID=1560006 RepID=A0A4Q1SEE2_9BACT|nr:mechanosensitive ion channel domain-containing protein [Silvibacterium dinghuense]RXS95634.1 mechanosensitive ion channel [Silvibacterium dinghuense]GGH14573.1 hypothetical protein GCM10011586_35100 [Silvibacterium dinghuense]